MSKIRIPRLIRSLRKVVREKEEKIKMFIVAATFAAHVCNNIQFVHFSGLDNKYCANHSKEQPENHKFYTFSNHPFATGDKPNKFALSSSKIGREIF